MYGPTKNLQVLTWDAYDLPFEGFTSSALMKHPDSGRVFAVFALENSVEVVQVEDESNWSPVGISFDEDFNAASAGAIRSFSLLCEGEERVILIFSDGSIFQAAFSSEFLAFECIGKIQTEDGGVAAASWSPDYTSLCLITGAGKRILLSSAFEPVEEGLVQVENYGSEEMISIGWGRKETQFHGTAGKAAALAQQQIKQEPVAMSEDWLAKVSWRGDGAYFAVSHVDSGAGRRLRIYDRMGGLLSTSEPVEGLESSLAWRPDGSLIASTQWLSAQNLRRVVFLERNGLRHGEFDLPSSEDVVAALKWNCDSSILAVCYRSGRVEMWTQANYHWYLKTRLPAPFAFFEWDQERADRFNCVSAEGNLSCAQLTWEQSGCESVVAVFDGKMIHLTPLSLCNIPPPMSLVSVELDDVPTCFCLAVDEKSNEKNAFVLVVADCKNTLYQFQIKLAARKSECSIILLSKSSLERPVSQVQIHDGQVICSTFDGELIESQGFSSPILRLLPEGLALLRDKTISRISGEFVDAIKNVGEYFAMIKRPDDTYWPVSMSINGRLWVKDVLITTQAISFCVSKEFLLLTTLTHQLVFLPLAVASVEDWVQLTAKALQESNTNEELARRVERGALLVSAVPESATVILQMPRGNLETIAPRAMVLSVLRGHLDRLEYSAAYSLCRRHRVDLNFLHDYAPELFLQSIGKFVKELQSVDYLNLFLSSLKDEDVTKSKYAGFLLKSSQIEAKDFSSKINRVSEAILAVLKEDFFGWVDSVMTVYVVQQPSRIEDALSCISQLAALNVPAETIEKSLKYLLFLVPAERLFDEALGMYDLSLALSIGRRSQKDPKDYVPLLERLASLANELQRRFQIDDFLGRHERALKHLFSDSEVCNDDRLSYMQKHKLYKVAVALTTDCSDLQLRAQVMELFGEHLVSSDALAAVICFRQAGRWERVVELACANAFVPELLAAMKHAQLTVAQIDTVFASLRAQVNCSHDALLLATILGRDQFSVAIEFNLMSEAVAAAEGDSEKEEKVRQFLTEQMVRLKERVGELTASFTDKSTRMLRLQKRFLAGPVQSTSTGTGNGDISDSISEMSFHTSATTIRSRTTNSSRRSSKKTEKIRLRDKPGSPHEREFLLYALKDLFGAVVRLEPDMKSFMRAALTIKLEFEATRAIYMDFVELIRRIKAFVEEFKSLQVKKISHFTPSKEPVDETGAIMENPLIDVLDAKFELPADFGTNFTVSIL